MTESSDRLPLCPRSYNSTLYGRDFCLAGLAVPSLLLTDIDTCESLDWCNQLCFLATFAVSLVCCNLSTLLLCQRRFLRRRVFGRQPFFATTRQFHQAIFIPCQTCAKLPFRCLSQPHLQPRSVCQCRSDLTRLRFGLLCSAFPPPVSVSRRSSSLYT